MPRVSFRSAVLWIADHPSRGEGEGPAAPDFDTNIEIIRQLQTVQLVANLFGRDPEEVAGEVLLQRAMRRVERARAAREQRQQGLFDDARDAKGHV